MFTSFFGGFIKRKKKGHKHAIAGIVQLVPNLLALQLVGKLVTGG